MKRKLCFWLFVLLGLAFGIASYFMNDKEEVKSLCSYTLRTGAAEVFCRQDSVLDPSKQSNSLILVNNRYKLSKISQPDEKLFSVYEIKNHSYKVRDTTVQLTRECLEAFNRMMLDFEAATGKHDVIVLSGYRSIEQQQELIDRETERSGAEKAVSLVAEVGGSEHHTGLALDLGIYTDRGKSKKFRAEGDYAWLIKNMYRYGFVVRYRSDKSEFTGIADEPWHIRYVGVPHAGAMEQLGYCLEEYIDYLHSFTASGQHLFIIDENKRYEVYTIKSGEAFILPGENAYSLSGDNRGNYIVTIEL